MTPALSFVVPMYNARPTIAPLVHDIERLEVEGGHEIVLVNDGERGRHDGRVPRVSRARHVCRSP